MKEQLQQLESNALAAIENAKTVEELEKIRLQYFGKKGELTQILKGLGGLPQEERPVMGAYANEVREEVQIELDKKKSDIKEAAYDVRMEEEYLDVTLNPAKLRVGHRHPLLKTKEELEDLFVEMGFTVVDGPEIESVANNFDALNSPKNHPSRDKSDTFYIDDKTL